jgi:predicted permease
MTRAYDSSRAVRLYRMLLRAYPDGFRQRFAEGMCASFEEELNQRRRFPGKIVLWSLTVWHVVVGALLEHVRNWRTPSRMRERAGSRHWLVDLALDVRYALRGLKTNPGLSLIVIATLGMGIGASTAIFSVVNVLLLRPLPFPEGDRLLRLRDTIDRPGQATWWYNSSNRSFHFVAEGASSFSSITAGEYRLFNLTGDGTPATVVGTAVADRWLETLRITPTSGRGFSPEEQRLGDEADGVMIGHGLWTRRFGRDAAVLGRALMLNGRTYTVMGVMPQGFNFPDGSQLWLMGTFDPNETGSGPTVIARLDAGISLVDAERELDVLSRSARVAYPDSHRGIRFSAVSLREDVVGNRSYVGVVLLAAVGALLLIACGNVANLLLIRATARRREFALRTALGAARFRQMRQLLTEGAVLAGLGWVLGLALAYLLTDATVVLSVPESYGLGEFFADISVDFRVLIFSILVTGATALLTALLPAIRASRTDIRHAITEGHPLSSRSSQPLLRAVVVAEVALAFVLLVGAGALVQDLRSVQGASLGFEVENRLVVPFAISPLRYGEADERVRFVQANEERVRALPGVAVVGMTQHTPVSLGDWTTAMTVEGGHESTPDNRLLANIRTVTPEYLKAMGVELVSGRYFLREENDETRNVIIVTQTMAEQHWPGQDPVGRRVKSGPIDNDNPWLTVVGVVRDVKEEWNGVDHTWYVPYRQFPFVQMQMVVQHSGSAASVGGSIESVVAEVDPEQPLGEIRPLGELVSESFSAERFGTLFAAVFATFGLFLAAMGVYGVLSFAVRQRVREIGLRMALGSSVQQVLSSVLGRGGTLLAAGAVLGLFASMLLAQLPRVEWADGDVNQFRLLASGINLDWIRTGGTFMLLALVTLLASYLPARRATQVSPVDALREE